MSTRTNRNTERGAALLLVMFAIILVSGFGVLLYFSSGTETHIDANYGGSLNAYYAARYGLEEVRDRVRYSAFSNSLYPPAFPTPVPGGGVGAGIAEFLPTDIAGNTGGVLYIVNPANGETVDPTDINSRYFDDQLCHDFNSGVPNGTKCTVMPTVANWNMSPLPSNPGPGTDPLPNVAYKWVRVNMKTNRIAGPYYVDGVGASSSLDTRICWDGFNEQLSPGGANASCDANGMQTVYMLTSMAVTPGVSQNTSRKVLRAEVVAPSIRPPGAVTMDAASVAPVLSAGAIPSTAIDGRVHQLDGSLTLMGGTSPTVYGPLTSAPTNHCSSVAAVATDTTQAATQMVQQLDTLRQNIVLAANASCNFDGTPTSPTAKCTAPLWYVRGIGANPRYIVPPAPTGGTTTTGTGTTGTGSTSGGSGEDHGGHGSSGGPGGSSGGSSSATGTTSTGTTSTPATFAPLCDPAASASCYANLDLTDQRLMAVSASIGSNGQLQMVLPPNPSSPFVGGNGNSLDPAIYQAGLPATVPNEVKTVANLVLASTNQANYTAILAANLSPTTTYGSMKSPMILQITDATGLQLIAGHPLIGFGILVVNSDLEISSTTLQWTGIVLVQGGSAKFVVGTGAAGFINGTLMLQPSSTSQAIIQTSTAPPVNQFIPTPFRISYSCDAIDMAFSSLPFKTISSSETTF